MSIKITAEDRAYLEKRQAARELMRLGFGVHLTSRVTGLPYTTVHALRNRAAKVG